jgi:hypothetical protein
MTVFFEQRDNLGIAVAVRCFDCVFAECVFPMNVGPDIDQQLDGV